MITFPSHMPFHTRTIRCSAAGVIGPARRTKTRGRLWLAACILLVAPSATTAQPAKAKGRPWSDAAADSMVARAIARRGQQLADSTLLSYTADAHGFLAFLAQIGEGVIIPPKVVQSEELALTVSWWQPGRSAQQLVGRRDTTLLPADVGYYRDRYGVVLDNLPDRIRLGDGQDVRDVPHPLASNARAIYEYERGNPLRITFPGREILVDEVKFRPRDATQPAAIGSVYLDRETGAVVKLSMTFTRAAMLDKRIETLFVTLENGLIRERYWLPRRQEVEVSRGSTWFDIPIRGIVRGHWEVAHYTVNERIAPETQALPRWSSLPKEALRAHTFEGRVVDVLPFNVQVASSEDVVHAREQAELAVRAAMLSRPTRATVTGRGISDLARFSRAEGFALGLGASGQFGTGFIASARARYGFSDGQLKGFVGLGRAPAFGRVPLVQLFIEREYRDLAAAERGGVTNSLASQLFGSDYTTQVDVRSAGVLLRRHPRDPFTLRLAYQKDEPLRVATTPVSGTFEPVLPAWRVSGVRAELRGTGGWIPGGTHTTRGVWSLSAAAGALRGINSSVAPDNLVLHVRPLVARATATLRVERTIGGDRSVMWQSDGGLAGGRDLPPQWLVFAGGPWSAPGYEFSQFATRAYVSQRFELRQPVPAPGIPLGKFGRSPSHITLAPFVQAIAVTNGRDGVRTPTAGIYPSVGLGTLFFFDLLRVDVARGLRNGQWRFAFDIDRGFWGIL